MLTVGLGGHRTGDRDQPLSTASLISRLKRSTSTRERARPRRRSIMRVAFERLELACDGPSRRVLTCRDFRMKRRRRDDGAPPELPAFRAR